MTDFDALRSYYEAQQRITGDVLALSHQLFLKLEAAIDGDAFDTVKAINALADAIVSLEGELAAKATDL